VRVSVDGVEGWEEAMTRFDPDATPLMVRYLAKGVLDMEFEDVRKQWDKS